MEGARYLEDGRLTIFRRSGIYYARLRTAASPRYITRSLKTSNEQTAVDLGRRLLFQLEQRAEEGLHLHRAPVPVARVRRRLRFRCPEGRHTPFSR